ncbi:hypothetical protein OIU77_005504, partial [Salix suchowensis]
MGLQLVTRTGCQRRDKNGKVDGGCLCLAGSEAVGAVGGRRPKRRGQWGVWPEERVEGKEKKRMENGKMEMGEELCVF